MRKWADYAVTAVGLSDDGKHIVAVGVRQDLGESLGREISWSKNRVLHMMLRGFTFVTATLRKDGLFYEGAKIEHEYVPASDRLFIRTDHDRSAADNLRNLPPLDD